MKKLLLIACLLIFSVSVAVAQQQGPGSSGGGNGNQGNSQMGNMGGSFERLVERLGLDQQQADAIALIFEDAQLFREEERERSRAAAAANRAETHAQISGLLTPEQLALFEEQHQQREALRHALEDLRAERGFEGGRGSRGCDG